MEEVVLSDLRYYTGIFKEELRKIMKTSVRAVSVLAEILTEHCMNSSQKCHFLDIDTV
jgi:hypothetical protein